MTDGENNSAHASMQARTVWRGLITPQMLRYFRLELTFVGVFIVLNTTLVIVTGRHVIYALYSFLLVILTVSPIFRTVSAYRMGYAMGLQAFPLAMAQPTEARAEALIERSSELWDPAPILVSHQLEIEALERDVNS